MSRIASSLCYALSARIRPPPAPVLAWLFLAYALPTILFLAVAMPPFQVADEHAHALRADQVSRGTLVSPRLGGSIDGAVYAFGRLNDHLRFNYDAKETVDIARKSAALRWTMPDRDGNFQNTAQYGPALYAPQVVGIWIGKLFGLTPVWTVLCARLVNGLASASIGFIAILLCRRGRAMTFTTLLLPMTMSEFTSLSQDALIIGFSILAITLASRIIDEQRSARIWEFSLFAFIIVATTMARPSQVALAALGPVYLGCGEVFWRRKAAIAAIAVACVAAWMIELSQLMPEPPSGAALSGQLDAMVGRPLLLPGVLLSSLRGQGRWLFETLIGYLGWVDTPLPHWYYKIAAAALLCACLASGSRPPYLYPAFIGAIALGAMTLAIGAALYMSWTPVGNTTVDGLQGRYMLVALPLVAWITPVWRQNFAKIVAPAWLIVVAFPLVSLTALPGAIMARYYGSWSEMGLVLRALFLT